MLTKKYFFITIFALILTIGFFFSCSRGSRSDQNSSSEEISIDDSKELVSPEAVDSNFSFDLIPESVVFAALAAHIASAAPSVEEYNRIVWIVEPKLEYDSVSFCSLDNEYYAKESTRILNVFANYKVYIVDRSTGKIVKEHDGHGGPMSLIWLYDSKNGTFGFYHFGYNEELKMYPINQFSEHWPLLTNLLKYVRQVDSAEIKNEKENEDDWNSYKLGSKYENSKYAVAYGSTLITDFIYDEPNIDFWGLQFNNAIPVTKDGKWGFINTKGELIVPLVFDHAESTDGETAFVKIYGKYGIIDVLASGGN